MRLTQILAIWPRNRPNGHIWSGKHRMVEKVKENHLKAMDKNIKMVRFLCLCVSSWIHVYKIKIVGKSKHAYLPESLHFSRA